MSPMKKYKLYKEVKPVNFNFEELLSYIILPLVIASYVSYPVLYFLGTTATILFNIVLAFVATYSYKGLKRFIPLDYNYTIEFGSVLYPLVSFLIIFSALLIADFGFYLLVVYQKNNEFNIFYFYSWLVILFGLPLLYYTLKTVQYNYLIRYQNLEFVNIVLAINHDIDLFLSINNIQFVNTITNNSSDIKIASNIRSYSQKEFLAMKTKTRHYYANKEGFKEQVQIPFNANLLLLSWFSFVEDKYYSIEIPFPFEKFIIEQKKHSTDRFKVCRGRESDPLYLHLYPNGGFKFFYKDVIVIDSPENIEIQINEEDKRMKFGIACY